MKTKHLLSIAVLTVPLLAAVFAMAGGGVGDACWLGITVENLSASEAAQMGVPTAGSRVVVIRAERAALAAGLIARDVILGIDGKPVDSIASFLAGAREAMARRGPGGRFEDTVVTVSRFAKTVTITVSSEVIAAYGVK